jgi:hypothetical protein
MKTPIQKLKQKINEIGLTNFPLDFLESIIELEQEEKELLIQFYADGFINFESGEEFYSKTFNHGTKKDTSESDEKTSQKND